MTVEPQTSATVTEPDAERLTLDDVRALATISVEQAGWLLGLARASAYKAAKRGEIPTIRMGKRLLVPVPALLAVLGAVQQPLASAAR